MQCVVVNLRILMATLCLIRKPKLRIFVIWKNHFCPVFFLKIFISLNSRVFSFRVVYPTGGITIQSLLLVYLNYRYITEIRLYRAHVKFTPVRFRNHDKPHFINSRLYFSPYLLYLFENMRIARHDFYVFITKILCSKFQIPLAKIYIEMISSKFKDVW